jgi:hypothetical protein
MFMLSEALKGRQGGQGVAFRHRERGLENICNELLKWRYSGTYLKEESALFDDFSPL